MKKTNKILSVLLAVVMLFSAMSISLCAYAFTPAPDGLWADPQDGLTQTTVTNGTGNANKANAKVLLDFLDETLANVELDDSVKDIINTVNGIGIKVNINSVDGILSTIDSVATLNAGLLTKTAVKLAFGYGLVTNNWTKGQTRAKTGDIAILKNLLGFLSDNKAFLGAFVADKTNIVSISTILGKDIKTFLKETLAKLFYDYEKDASLKSKYDAAVKKTVDNIIFEDGLGDGLNGLLKDLDNTVKSKWVGTDKESYNEVWTALYNEYGFKFEGLLAGFKFDSSKNLDATLAQIADVVYTNIYNAGYLQKLLINYGAVLQNLIVGTEFGAPFAKLLKFDKFTASSDFSFLNFKTTGSIKGLNDFLGQLVGGVTEYKGWNNKTMNLGGNFIALVKWAIDNRDKTVASPFDEYNFEGDTTAYALALAQMIVNAIDTIPAEVKAALKKCNSASEVVTKLVPELCKSNDAIVIGAKSTTWDKVLGDIVGSFLDDYAVLYTDTKNTTRYTKGSGKGIWDVLNYAANYYLVDLNFDTILGCSLSKSESVLSKLDKLQDKLFGTLKHTNASVYLPALINNILALDFNKLVNEGVEKAFTDINTDVSAIKLVYTFVNNILGSLVGTTVFAGTFSTLDNLVSAASLESAVGNLLVGLNTRKEDLLPVILYVLSAIDTDSVFTVTAGKDGAVSVKYAGVTLKKDTDYTVSTAIYSKGKSCKVTVAGKGNFGGKTAVISACSKHSYGTAKVTKAATTSKNGTLTYTCKLCGGTKTSTVYYAKTFKLSKTEYTYTGKALKPSVTVKDSKGTTLKNGTDYTVKYSNNTKVGQATVTITLKGKYSGTKKLTFKILPKGTTISKVTAAKKAFTASWKKNTTETTGYQIQYCTSKKFPSKSTKTVTVTSAKTTSKKISKLKAKTTYYVRVRTYKTVKISGKSTKLYSSWSAVKSVKTK